MYEKMKRVVSANAKLKHLKGYLVNIIRYAMVLSFFKNLTLQIYSLMSVYTFQLPAFTGSRSEEVFNEHSSHHGSKHIQGTLRESVMYPDTSRPSCTSL